MQVNLLSAGAAGCRWIVPLLIAVRLAGANAAEPKQPPKPQAKPSTTQAQPAQPQPAQPQPAQAPSAPNQSQASANEIIANSFAEPDLIVRFDRALQLTPDQQQYIGAEVKRATDRLATLQGQIKRQTELLAPMVTPPVVEEEVVLPQAEKILQLEREVKLAQLRLLVRANNILTPSQKAQLKAIQQKVLTLQEKWATVQQLMRLRQKEGVDLGDFTPLKTEYEAAIAEGAIDKAERTLDRALEQLQNKSDKPAGKPASPKAGR